MAPTPPSSEPNSLVIGANWEWDKHVSLAPPSDGYTLRYDLHGPSDVDTIVATTSVDGDFYEVRVAKAATAGLEAGSYVLVGYVEMGTARHEIHRAVIQLLEDVSVATAARSIDEQILANLDQAILDLTLSPHRSTQVNGRKVEFSDLTDLVRMQGVYRARVARARRGGRILQRKARFAAPSH